MAFGTDDCQRSTNTETMTRLITPECLLCLRMDWETRINIKNSEDRNLPCDPI